MLDCGSGWFGSLCSFPVEAQVNRNWERVLTLSPVVDPFSYSDVDSGGKDEFYQCLKEQSGTKSRHFLERSTIKWKEWNRSCNRLKKIPLFTCKLCCSKPCLLFYSKPSEAVQ